MMMTSPLVQPHSRSISHTPSPTSSPKLVPVPSTMASISLPLSSSALSALPSTTTSQNTLNQSTPTRSFARGPQARPYGPPTLRKKELDGDTKRFAELVVETVEERRRLLLASSSPVSRGRTLEGEKGSIETVENVNLQDVHHGPRNIERRGTQGRLMSSSWEAERADLIVDYPVWSPGCFQGTLRFSHASDSEFADSSTHRPLYPSITPREDAFSHPPALVSPPKRPSHPRDLPSFGTICRVFPYIQSLSFPSRLGLHPPGSVCLSGAGSSWCQGSTGKLGSRSQTIIPFSRAEDERQRSDRFRR